MQTDQEKEEDHRGRPGRGTKKHNQAKKVDGKTARRRRSEENNSVGCQCGNEIRDAKRRSADVKIREERLFSQS